MDDGLIIRRVTVVPFMENVYLVGDSGTRECLVIDPGAEAERILHELKEQGLTLQLILIPTATWTTRSGSGPERGHGGAVRSASRR